MIIDIISDIHIDFYLKPTIDNVNNNVFSLDEVSAKELYDRVFAKRKSDTLIIAGDIGHFNKQNLYIISFIRENYYKNIICVLGNHDYYLIYEADINRYNNNSLKRVREQRAMLNSLDGVYCLDGNIIEIDGIKFGGCDSWYDGEYYLWRYGHDYPSYPKFKEHMIKLWHRNLNDANHIKGIKDFYELFYMQTKKLEQILKSNVIVTHVCPAYCRLHGKYEENMNGFYGFNGYKYLEETKARYWIFGHYHYPLDFEEYETKCIGNPLGYPSQSEDFEIKTIEI